MIRLNQVFALVFYILQYYPMIYKNLKKKDLSGLSIHFVVLTFLSSLTMLIDRFCGYIYTYYESEIVLEEEVFLLCHSVLASALVLS